jgi:hypothetical protein
MGLCGGGGGRGVNVNGLAGQDTAPKKKMGLGKGEVTKTYGD